MVDDVKMKMANLRHLATLFSRMAATYATEH